MIRLYRRALRSVNRSHLDPVAKRELRQHARSSFEQMRTVSNEADISWLIAEGKVQLTNMENSLLMTR